MSGSSSGNTLSGSVSSRASRVPGISEGATSQNVVNVPLTKAERVGCGCFLG